MVVYELCVISYKRYITLKSFPIFFTLTKDNRNLLLFLLYPSFSSFCSFYSFYSFSSFSSFCSFCSFFCSFLQGSLRYLFVWRRRGGS